MYLEIELTEEQVEEIRNISIYSCDSYGLSVKEMIMKTFLKEFDSQDMIEKG